MKLVSFRSYLLAALFAVAPALACAQKVDGLLIKPGDSIEDVQAAFKTDQQPVESQSAVQRNAKALRLTEHGVWVFFDKDGRSYTIRLETPFQGNVGGVKIGSTQTSLIEALGQPVRVVENLRVTGTVDSHIYYIEGGVSARFDFDREARIERILISKRTGS